MNRISHKQALQWIDRCLDGLLTQKQLLVLDEHLRSCDACRAYAAEMDQLPARLQNELHARWDEKPGPSPKIMQHVTTKAGHNPMKNHTYSASELFAGALMLIGLAFALNFFVSQLQNTFAAANGTEVADAPSRSQEQLIAFVSTQSGNSDIYTMQTDGSAVTNLTNDPGEDIYPVWSPDGNRIAFISNRDGSDQLYVMDADGSNHTRLTEDPVSITVPTFSPDGTKDVLPVWSPDSTRIAYAAQDPAGHVSNIYIVDIAGQNRRLTDTDPQTTMLWPEAWSLDGQYLFFHMNSLFWKADTNTGDIAGLTAVAELTLQLVLSKDGSNFLYLDWCGQSDLPKFCAWVATMNQDKTNAKLNATVELQNVCQSAELLPALFIDYHNTIKWSPDRTKILFAFYCKENGGSLYIANADGSDFKPLLNYPVLYKAALFDWSPDSQSIVFSSALDNAESASTYILNINDALQNPDLRPVPLNTAASQISFFAWQPVLSLKVAKEEPTPVTTHQSTPEADSRYLLFTANANGAFDIFRTRPDGSETTNLTDHPANDDYPFWSPDGTRIAFESDRNGSNQIYLMDADGFNVVQVTGGEMQHRLINVLNPWSPDGTRLLVMEWTDPSNVIENDKWTLYAMSLDGQEKIPLAQMPAPYLVKPSWAPDGEHVAFVVANPASSDVPRLHIVNADGSNLTEVTNALPENESLWAYTGYYWSPDGQSIFFIASRGSDAGKDRWTAYEFSLADRILTGKAISDAPMGDWWAGTSFITGFADDRETAFTWLRSDETSSTLKPFEECELVDEPQYGATYQRSANGNLMIAAHCPGEDWLLYWANPDGTLIKPLLDAPIPAEDVSFPANAWSSDDKFITINISLNDRIDIYMLNVESALNDPFIQPVKVTTQGGMMFYHPSWQPLPKDEVVREKPTPEPKQTPEISSESGLIAVPCASEYGNLDICLTHPDGQGSINLTNNPAEDTNPFWSPDGKRIAFESDRSGTFQVYLMDVDGSNIVQLTTGATAHYLPVNVDGITYPWSPDGSKILVLQGNPGEQTWTLISQDIKEGDQISLVTGQLYASGISWAPDGKYIGYLMDTSPDSPPLDPGIHIADINGNSSRNLKEVIPHTEQPDSRYRWSSDGKSIIFTTVRNDPAHATIATIVYEYEPSNDTLLQKDNLKEMGDWENSENLVTEFRTSERSGLIFVWQYPDGQGNLLNVDDQCSEFNIRRSPLGNFVIAASCPDNRLKLYWANSDGSLTNQLLDVSFHTQNLNISDMVWSHDDKYIAFNLVNANNLTDMYILNVQAILNNESLSTLHETLSDGTKIYITNNPVQIPLGGGFIVNYGVPSWQPIP